MAPRQIHGIVPRELVGEGTLPRGVPGAFRPKNKLGRIAVFLRREN